MKDRFSLTTVTTLLSVVSSFSLRYQCLVSTIMEGSERAMGGRYLGKDTRFTGFVLGDFVDCVFSAVFAFAVGTTSFWNVDCMSVSARSEGTGYIPMAADEVDNGHRGIVFQSCGRETLSSPQIGD